MTRNILQLGSKAEIYGLILKLNGGHKAIKLGRINFLDSLELLTFNQTRDDRSMVRFPPERNLRADFGYLFTPEVLLPELTLGRLLLYSIQSPSPPNISRCD